MSKREELEKRRNELDKELNKNNIDDTSLYEKSILVSKLIALFGNIALIFAILFGIFTSIKFNGFLIFKIIILILYILFGFVIKVFFDAISLLLKNLAELNNK